jgi:hypothetical protein
VNYRHTQRAPLHYILHAFGVVILAGAWLARDEWPAVAILCFVAAVMILFGFMFADLTVRDEGDFLEIQFGPLPVFCFRIRYAEVKSVERSRSAIIDGWGIHTFPGRGTTYNLWGFDCVKLDVNGKTVRIGSDDVDQLVAFLETKTS